MTYNSIITAIIERIQTITDTPVYSFEPQQPNSTPFITVLPARMENAIYSSCSNRIKKRFKITIADDISDNDYTREQAETVVLGLADDILADFIKKDAFSEYAHLAQIENGEPKYLQREGGFSRIFELFITFDFLLSTNG